MNHVALFDDFVSNQVFLKQFDRTITPTFASTRGVAVDETKSHYQIAIDMPGVRKENIDVQIERDLLRVTGRRHPLFESKESPINEKQERRSLNFSKTFQLPKDIDLEKLKAEYVDGVLQIELGKAVTSMPRKIEVS